MTLAVFSDPSIPNVCTPIRADNIALVSSSIDKICRCVEERILVGGRGEIVRSLLIRCRCLDTTRAHAEEVASLKAQMVRVRAHKWSSAVARPLTFLPA